MKITRLDHLVLTVSDVEATCEFYRRVLGLKIVTFGANRRALGFGAHKINLHQSGRESEPKAARPTPGAGDLCFLTETPLTEVEAHLRAENVEILGGPIERTGARKSLLSLYFRDLDGNLIEVANEL